MKTLPIKVTTLQSHIIRIEYPDECLITLDDARELTRKVYGHGKSGPFGIIHVAGKETTIEDGIREYLSERSKTGDKIAVLL